ncbi:MAG TPA: thymidine phosphorylase [Gemmatimonadota bacterium]|nr:thymidine phosphorylase [Gemmatimonadota bacterium]
MIPAELIIRKRDGGSLAEGEWAAFLSGYLAGEVAEYQVSALLMAVFFQGLSDDETRWLTQAMIDSGERWSWPPGAPLGDKHSTGGVGDKVSLVLAPLAAACGVRVPMVSGRGLAHTGGTLDSLESIPGFRTNLSKADFDRLLEEVGYAMGGQTDDFVPLDRELYALRDVTGTVESIPLIIASILSKKIAEGISGLVLDVKWGDGAFMRTPGEAERLARELVGTAEALGVRAEALLTDMNIPLGRTVGHSLEVQEAIAMLRGEPVEPRLAEVVVRLTERLLVLTGVVGDETAAGERVKGALEDGAALERFRAGVAAQGGDPRIVDDPARLPAAPVRRALAAPRRGILAGLPARAVGRSLVALGGGRRFKGDQIDLAVGFEFPRVVGEEVEAGEPWAVVHSRDEESADRAQAGLEGIAVWSREPVELPPVVTARIGGDG